MGLRSVRPKVGRWRGVLVHWTGGQARPGTVDTDTDGDGLPDFLDPDDDGDGLPDFLDSLGPSASLDALYRTLRTTTGPRTPDGLSVHVGIAPDGRGERWVADSHVAFHGGVANPDFLGIEVCSPGYSVGKGWATEKALGVQRTEYVDRIRGIPVRMVDFTDAQFAALAEVLEDWTTRHGIPRDFPREADGRLARRPLTPGEWGVFRGVAGHFHCHDVKNDPGTRVFLRLAQRWGVPLR